MSHGPSDELGELAARRSASPVARPVSSGYRAGRPLIALAGNPNTGKTSLFNRLTGLHGRVGNYAGVTVELMTGSLELPALGRIDVVDVPGCYSLVARSAEEQVAIDHLLGLGGQPRPDLVVVCVDASNLLRNLYLVLQLQELGVNMVVALTMMDEARAMLPEPERLVTVLGCPVVPLCVPKREGFDRLNEAIATRLRAPQAAPRWRWRPSEALAAAIAGVRAAMPADGSDSDALALWFLMSVEDDDELQHVPASVRRAVTQVPLDRRALDDEVIEARYAWIDREAKPLLAGAPNRARTEKVDAVLIHPMWGFGVFLAIMFVLFQALFAWADPAIGLIESGFGWLAGAVEEGLPEGVFRDLLVEGVIGGAGSVVVFLPQILLLFFLLGLMEDSGYMARVAYLMDRIMRTMGLHGRAFVPMLSGYACAIPAIMATRTMERQRDRLLTMMVVPLMTCSARLPVYTLIIGALFPPAVLMGFVPLQAGLMVALYVLSVVMALGAAWVLSKTVFRGADAPLLLELPPYRLPRINDVARMMWSRTRYFLSEAGTIILLCSVVLWALASFPRDTEIDHHYDAQVAAAETEEVVQALSAERAAAQLHASYAGRFGRLLEPVIAPLGFDWKIGVGLVGAFAAREVFVATMGIVYSAGEDVDEEDTTLRERIRAERAADGSPRYPPLVGLSLLVFFALACQCMSTLAVVRRETGSWRWPLFLFGYMSVLAWSASFLVYQGGRALGLG